MARLFIVVCKRQPEQCKPNMLTSLAWIAIVETILALLAWGIWQLLSK